MAIRLLFTQQVFHDPFYWTLFLVWGNPGTLKIQAHQDLELQVILGNIARSRSTWTMWDPVSNQAQQQKNGAKYSISVIPELKKPRQSRVMVVRTFFFFFLNF